MNNQHHPSGTWIRFQSMAFRPRPILISALIAIAAALGVWSEVRAAGTSRTKKIVSRSLHVAVHPGGANASLTVAQQLDGSTWMNGQVFAQDQLITVGDWQTQGDVAVNNIDPNPYAKAAASGVATAWTDFNNAWGGTPVTLDVALLAQPGSASWAASGSFTHSGIVEDDGQAAWDAGRAARVSTSGSEAFSFTGGTLTVTVDGRAVLNAGGGSAHLQENTSHTVQILQK